MGTVYRAMAPDHSQVAIKLLTQGRQATSEQLTRFEREVRALRKVSHPNLVRLLDHGLHEGLPYLVMDLCEGGTLGQRLDAGQLLDPVPVAEIGIQLAMGLEAAHAEGLLHRDVKPDNVLLSARGLALLTDFGLAKDLSRLAQTQALSQSGLFIGTPGYCAPEQAAGRLEEFGPATDVYGLGATLYASLTGRAPVSGGTLVEFMIATSEEKPKTMRSIRPEVPFALDAIVLRCLEKDPAARWGSAEALAEALRGYLRGDPAPSSRRSLGFWALGISLGLAAIAAGAVASRSGTPVEPGKADTPQPTERSSPSPSTTPASQAARIELLAGIVDQGRDGRVTSLAALQLLRLAPNHRLAIRARYRVRSLRKRPLCILPPLPNGLSEAHALFFSPGSSYVLGVGEGGLVSLDLRTPKLEWRLIQFPRRHRLRVRGMGVRSEGRQLWFMERESHQLRRVPIDVEGGLGTPTADFDLQPDSYRDLRLTSGLFAISPGGRYLVYAERNKLALFDLTDAASPARNCVEVQPTSTPTKQASAGEVTTIKTLEFVGSRHVVTVSSEGPFSRRGRRSFADPRATDFVLFSIANGELRERSRAPMRTRIGGLAVSGDDLFVARSDGLFHYTVESFPKANSRIGRLGYPGADFAARSGRICVLEGGAGNLVAWTLSSEKKWTSRKIGHQATSYSLADISAEGDLVILKAARRWGRGDSAGLVWFVGDDP